MNHPSAEFDFDFESSLDGFSAMTTTSHTDPLRATFSDLDLAPARATLPPEFSRDDYWAE